MHSFKEVYRKEKTGKSRSKLMPKLSSGLLESALLYFFKIMISGPNKLKNLLYSWLGISDLLLLCSPQ